MNVDKEVKYDEMDEYNADEWDEKAIAETARRNQLGWRADCVQICESDLYSQEVRDLAARLIWLIDDVACMYHGGPLKLKSLNEMVHTLEKLREKVQ